MSLTSMTVSNCPSRSLSRSSYLQVHVDSESCVGCPAAGTSAIPCFRLVAGTADGLDQKMRSPHISASSARSGSLMAIERRLSSLMSVPSKTAQHSSSGMTRDM